jgi:Fe2+ or Zn2+ uptake regulation protein
MKGEGNGASRLPKNYDAIRRVVEAAQPGSHRTTAEIYAEARKLQPQIGYSTVQRGLARLVDLGYVLAVRLPDEAGVRYEARTQRHGHFLCAGCGAVLDVPYALSERTIERLAAELGVRVEDHAVSLLGRCGACP